MTPEDQNDGPPPHPRHLDDDKKLEVWRALRSKADPKFPFHEWYVGALAAVASTDESNPDRLAHAGNGLREILEKLPGDLETEITDRNILRQSRSAMAAAIAQARHEYGAGWAGEITEKLATALQTVDSYLELPDTPTRAERIFSGLSKFDPMMHALPSERQRQKRQLYQRISKKLEQFTHHHCGPMISEFRDRSRRQKT